MKSFLFSKNIVISLKGELEGKGKSNYGFLSISPLVALGDTNKLEDKRKGGVMPGASIKAFYRGKAGKPIYLAASISYATNSEHHHLLPFIPFGLGRPESYIEKLVVRYPGIRSSNIFNQPGVPPNSECVIRYDAKNEVWRLQTFLSPYLTVGRLAVIITVILVILGTMWLYLDYQERKSMDAKNKTGTASQFFF